MSTCFGYNFQEWIILSLGLVAASLTIGVVLVQVGHGQNSNNCTEPNATRSYLSSYDGSMNTFILQTLFGPPEIKFNLTDLMSPKMKQYISDSCKFYHEKSGVWLTGTDNDLDKQIISKYGAEFIQKVKEPESLKQRDQTYIQLNKTN